jgi:hypothetical protein
VRLIASAAVVTTLAVLAAGCGGGGSSKEEQWASSVCTNVANWKQQIQSIGADARSKLQSPSVGTLDAIKADVNKAVDATKQLSSNLKALGAPNSGSGTQAKQQIDSLATQLENTVNMAKQTTANLPKNATLSQTVSQLASLAPALESLLTNTKTTLSSVQTTGSDIKKGFDQAKSCKQFRSGS